MEGEVAESGQKWRGLRCNAEDHHGKRHRLPCIMALGLARFECTIYSEVDMDMICKLVQQLKLPN